jgi:DNA repair protein RecO (recombination protein O)
VPILATEAIVLRAIEYSETSLIVWLFTREHGRVHVIAKGARRARSPFEGALEPLVRGELVFYRKARSEGLETAKEFDPHDLHLGLRKDLQRLYRGLYVGELLTELSQRELPSEETFDAAAAALRRLARGDASQLDATLFDFELLLLRSAGFAPRLDGCVQCDAPLSPDEPAWFTPGAGGVQCRQHAGKPPATRTVSRGALLTLRALTQGTQVQIGREVTRELRELLDAFFAWHLERPLRMSKHLKGLIHASPPRRSRRA